MQNIFKDTLYYDKHRITEQHIKEGIGKAYVKAVTHYAGFNTKEYGFDYGMDGSVSGVKVDGQRVVSDGWTIDFQLKSSINVEDMGDTLKYKLEAKTYNDLVDTDIGTPRILILYKMPREREEWLKTSESDAIFKECAWWCSLYGQEKTTNISGKVIHIPKEQVFDAHNIKILMSRVKEGKFYDNR